MTNRGEAIGVLELCLPQPPDDDTVADVALAAHALAYVVIANRRFTDLFEWGQRSVPLSVGAEIQHRLLPASYTCEAGQFTLAGWLEPAGDNAGDTFDFSLERNTLHLSLTDAMGHDTSAALLATLLVGALRNARRADAGLTEQARLANAAIADRYTNCEFVTDQLVRIDLPTATAGDRLLFFTDGMLERNAANLDLHALVAACADAHPREAVQHLMTAVIDAADGQLRDDATALCVDWHGGPERQRTSHAGANS